MQNLFRPINWGVKDKDLDVFTIFTIKTYFFFVFDVLQSLGESSEINSDIAVNNSSKIKQCTWESIFPAT